MLISHGIELSINLSRFDRNSIECIVERSVVWSGQRTPAGPNDVQLTRASGIQLCGSWKVQEHEIHKRLVALTAVLA